MTSITDFTDIELIQKIAAGDEAAFSELYSRYNQPVYNFILRLLHQTPAAEDLLQDVFLAVWQGASQFRGKSTVKTWVFRIAYYQAISWLRKNKKADQIHRDIDDYHITDYQPQAIDSFCSERNLTAERPLNESCPPGGPVTAAVPPRIIINT